MPDSGKAVFLSYASQDAEAAKKICDALRAVGIEVWFDQSELVGGDAWDQKIRRNIKECELLIPIISANTQARTEGYFRLEWRLADQRTHLMAKGRPFLLPVVIDGTRDSEAQVPDSFTEVQWTKLPGGETTTAFVARVAKLLSGEPRVRSWEAKEDGEKPRLQPASPRWLRPILATLVIVIGVLAFTLKQSFDRQVAAKALPPAPPSAPASAASLPAVSPARELVTKALTLIHGLDATRGDFTLAEEYCQQALKLDRDDGEVWAAYSQVHSAFGYRGWDTSPERREQTRVTAENAMQRAPRSVNARLAQAGAWATFNINHDEREKLLREIVSEEPHNQEALRFLAVTVLAKPDGLTEALALNERSAALPGGDPLALFNNARYLWQRGRADEGYATLKRALAQQKFTSGLVLKMATEINSWGDLATAETTLREIPPDALLEDRANYVAGLLRFYQRDGAAALAIWQTFPRDFYVDFVYDGPKGLLVGLACELDGRDAAARAEWRTALQLVDKKIAATPNKPTPYYSRAYLLACLGEKAAANEALQTYEQLAGIKYSAKQPMPLVLAQVYARLGRFDEIFAAPPATAAIYRISPNFDTLRTDARFERWVGAPLSPHPAASAFALAPPSVAAAEVDPKSVAVLAFANLSEDKANEYFSDGISEELLTVLQKIPGLRVSSRTSAFSFKGRDVSVQEIGHALGVSYLIEGSVRRAGGKVRVTARLSDTGSGRQLWSENYTRNVEDVFALQTELAQTIVGQLQEQLAGTNDIDDEDVVAQVTAAQKGGTQNVAAHELYLRGRYFANQPSTENLGKAVDFLQRAVDLDPEFALAWGALARNVAIRAEYLDTTPETLREAFARARRAADRAIALAPKLPDGYIARLEIQTAYDYDWPGARESLQQALALAPTDALLVSNASQLATQFGDVSRSVELGRRAAELDPVNPEIRYWLGRAYICAGRLTEGEAELRRAAELSPALLSVHRQLSTVLVLQGHPAPAVAEARLEKDDWSRQAALAVACWAAKDIPAADAALAELKKIGAENAAFQVAEAHAFRGESDAAFQWLDRAYRNRDSGFGQVRVDPLLKNLRADARWMPLLRQAGLTDEQLK